MTLVKFKKTPRHIDTVLQPNDVSLFYPTRQHRTNSLCIRFACIENLFETSNREIWYLIEGF